VINITDGIYLGSVHHACGKKFFHVMPSNQGVREIGSFAHKSAYFDRLQVTLAKAMEFCCKFGLRLLTLDTPAKVQCMVQNNVHSKKSMHRFFQSRNLNFAVGGAFQPGQLYMVAATRMGNISNPRWCFSDVPFFPTPTSDSVTSNTNPAELGIIISYSGPLIAAYSSFMYQIACESIN
jgi:hypothetical protein